MTHPEDILSQSSDSEVDALEKVREHKLVSRISNTLYWEGRLGLHEASLLTIEEALALGITATAEAEQLPEAPGAVRTGAHRGLRIPRLLGGLASSH